MARKVLTTSRELENAIKLRDDATTARELKQALSFILMGVYKFSSDQVCDILGISNRTIFRNRSKIRNQDSDNTKPWGGRRRNLLSPEEEIVFLSKWKDRAISGEIISIPSLHADLIKHVGHEFPISTTYRILARNKWRKVQPDTKHPKSNTEIQEEFKKKSRNCWLPQM